MKNIYVQREGSIMSQNNYEKTKKKVSDFYNHYLFLIEEIEKTSLDSTIFKSFISSFVTRANLNPLFISAYILSLFSINSLYFTLNSIFS